MTVVTLGGEWVVPRGRHGGWRISRKLWTFCFLVWVLMMPVYSACKNLTGDR